MSNMMRTIVAIVLLLAVYSSPAAATWSHPFDNFYPMYRQGLKDVLSGPCAERYALYLSDPHNISGVDEKLIRFGLQSRNLDVVECILEELPEFVKAKLGVSQIILGLTPSLVASIAVRPHDVAVLSVLGRRHFLALSLAIGSPAVSTFRSSEFTSVIAMLRDKPLPRPRILQRLDPILVAVELLLALAAIANVAELAWKFGSQVINTALPSLEYCVLIWASVGFVIHVLSAAALCCRVTVIVQVPSEKEEEEEKEKGEAPPSQLWLVAAAKRRFKILSRQVDVVFAARREGMLFSTLALTTTTLATCHIIFGTIVFSSGLFIGTWDSLIVLCRLVASALLCRIVVTYELLVLRESLQELSGTGIYRSGLEL